MPHQDRSVAYDEWRGLIRTTVAQGIARGEIRPAVDGDALALVMIATLEGAVMLARLLRDAALRLVDGERRG